MNIPRHWVRAREVVATKAGDRRELTAWGWSATSRTDADEHAQRRLADLVARSRRGDPLPQGYGYGSRPPREEIIETLLADDGTVEAVLTRNAYGSLVVNAAGTLFVDVDLPEPTLRDRIDRWLGRTGRTEAATLEGLRGRLSASWGSYRIYRTAAGFRVMATDPTFRPGSSDAERLMTELGADPAFVQLCRAQGSFRARLTPKPWRCDMQGPPSDFPREDEDARAAFDSWLARYEHACTGYATCGFVEQVGAGRVHPATVQVLALHDARARAGSGLPLA